MTGHRTRPRVAPSLVRSSSRPEARSWPSGARCSAAPVSCARRAVRRSLRRTPTPGEWRRGPREPQPSGSSSSYACRSGHDRRPPALPRRSRCSGNGHGRAGRCDDRSTGTRCTWRTRRGRPSRSPWSHGSSSAAPDLAVAAQLETVLAAGTTELGAGMTVRVQVAIGVGVGATLRPGDRRPARWGSQCGRRHQTHDDPLHSITPIAVGSVRI